MYCLYISGGLDSLVFYFISTLYFSMSGGLDFLVFYAYISYIFPFICSSPYSRNSQKFRI